MLLTTYKKNAYDQIKKNTLMLMHSCLWPQQEEYTHAYDHIQEEYTHAYDHIQEEYTHAYDHIQEEYTHAYDHIQEEYTHAYDHIQEDDICQDLVSYDNV